MASLRMPTVVIVCSFACLTALTPALGFASCLIDGAPAPQQNCNNANVSTDNSQYLPPPRPYESPLGKSGYDPYAVERLPDPPPHKTHEESSTRQSQSNSGVR